MKPLIYSGPPRYRDTIYNTKDSIQGPWFPYIVLYLQEEDYKGHNSRIYIVRVLLESIERYNYYSHTATFYKSMHLLFFHLITRHDCMIETSVAELLIISHSPCVLNGDSKATLVQEGLQHQLQKGPLYFHYSTKLPHALHGQTLISVLDPDILKDEPAMQYPIL